MSDKLFCATCVGTEHAHAIWAPCPHDTDPVSSMVAELVGAFEDFVLAIAEQNDSQAALRAEMAKHFRRLATCQDNHRAALSLAIDGGKND